MSDFTTQADHPSSDRERGDLETEEVWRAAAAAGHDTDVSIQDAPSGAGDQLRCEGCGTGSPVERFVLVEASLRHRAGRGGAPGVNRRQSASR